MASSSSPSPSARNLAWISIIETLADSKLAPVGLLSQLIKAVPEFYTAAPQSARERVALRYLQECAGRGLVQTSSAHALDASQQSAEDFLCNNLTRFPSESLLRSTTVPISADIRCFIEQKRSALPKPYLGDVAVDIGQQEVTPGQRDQNPTAATEHGEPVPETCIPTEPAIRENNEDSRFSVDLLDDLSDHEISPVGSQISLSQHDDQCIFCNQGGGQLLTCSTKFCGLTVHKTCILITPTSFNKQGRFYCPCCACTRAARACERAQEFLSHARESMFTFEEKKKNKKQQEGQDEKQPVEENLDSKSRDKKAQLSDYATTEDEVGDATRVNRSENSDGNGDMPKDNRDMLARDKENEKQEAGFSFAQVDKHVDTKLGLGATSRGHEAVSMNAAENKSRKGVNAHAKRRRKPRPRYSNKVVPPHRRKILPWTKEEEQALREGMQNCEVRHDGRISWSTILEYGGDVFHKTRLPIDLKDKWRNMMKKEGSVSL